MGFKIDAVAVLVHSQEWLILLLIDIKAEIKFICTHCDSAYRVEGSCKASDPALSLVVWTLKRKVRAFGGCLGMHRR